MTTHRLTLSGEIDRTAEERLDAAYAEAEQAGASALLLDFSAVDYINSTGIALIVGVLARARAAGLRVRACGLSDHYREIFEITRLADFIDIIETEESTRA